MISFSSLITSRQNQRKNRLGIIRYDLQLLRMLSERPTTVYDVIKKFNYPHSSAHGILQQYLKQGIIRNVKEERCHSGLIKKYYMLTELGLSLLSILEKINENRQKII